MYQITDVDEFSRLGKMIAKKVKPMLEKWSDRKLSNKARVYGIRKYTRGAWLSLHVDKPTSHILSVIIQVLNCTSLSSI